MRFTWLSGLRPRPEWLPRCSVGLGIGSTIAMNVAGGSRGGPGGALVAALYPVAFVIALETLIFMVRRLARLPWGWAWCIGAGIPLAGMAGITGVISYLHALTVVEWTGSTGLPAHLGPLVPDQLIVTGSVALVALAVAGKQKAAGKTETAGAGREAARPPREGPAPRQPKTVSKPSPGPAGKTSGPVRVRDLVKDLPPARVDQLAAMSKRDLAAELGVTTWAAELWQRERKKANGHDPVAVSS